MSACKTPFRPKSVVFKTLDHPKADCPDSTPLRTLELGCKAPPMKYDDASWHYGGDFPVGLPPEAGATHIAMFLAWAVLNGLAGEYHTNDAADELARLERREVTPTQWFIQACDEKFTDEDLDDQGNSFAATYYSAGEGLHAADKSYLTDYCDKFPTANSLYEVEDSWASFDALAPIIASRFEEWRSQ